MFYRLTRALFRLVAAVMFRFRVEGAERVPRHGPAVLIAPHRSWLDPPCLGGACPRPIRFLIVRSVYDKRWARWFYRRMHAIPVNPGGLGSLAALRGALRHLASGQLVGVFPEGRVVGTGSETRIHAGAALLAVRGQAPVIPAEIHGSARAWPHGRLWPGPAPVRVRFRSPLFPPRRGPSAVKEMSGRLESLMRGLGEATAGDEGASVAQGRVDRGRQ